MEAAVITTYRCNASAMCGSIQQRSIRISVIIEHNGKDIKLPDFLIVGAAKSGTTSLHYYLKQHPQIFLPKVKELRFFRK